MSKQNTARRAMIWSVMAGLVLSTGAVVIGNTVTVVNVSQNGPSDLMNSGTTPGTLFRTHAGGGALAGNNAYSQFFNGVSRLDFNVQHESVSVFVGTNGGEGALGEMDVQGGELKEVAGDQVYVAELISDGGDDFTSGGKNDFIPQTGFEEYHVGSGFDSIAPGELAPGSHVNTLANQPITPVPESGTFLLMATLGISLLGVKRRRRADSD